MRDNSSVTGVLAALARGALGAGYVPEVPGRMLGLIERLPTAQERSRLLATLRALDTKAGARVLTGRAVPVSWLSPAAAEALLRRWKASRVAPQRQLSTAITSLATFSLYAYPGPGWARIGYPGPLGPPPDTEPLLHPLEVTEDVELTCDAVVVGSGAGGGCVAGHLAEAGYDVVVLEKGGYFGPAQFDHVEHRATQDLYLYAKTLATSDLGVRIIAGSTLGGGTVVNYTTSFRPPPHVLRQWHEVSGIDAFVSGEMDASLDEVSARINVNTDSSAAGPRDTLMEEGLKKLGWHVDMMPRSVSGCTQDETCGFCGFGCRAGAKRSRTFLETAAANGARLVTGSDVRHVAISDGRATGVEAVCGTHAVRVKARAVVVAGGAIETPALLLRSGLRGQVGHNLRLHPGSAAWGHFDDEVHVWEGTLQARYSNEFRDWDGGYGPIYETVPVHPGEASNGLPWTSIAQHRDAMALYPKMSFVGALPRDSSAGRVRIARDGNPRVHYRLNAEDAGRIAEAVIGAAKVLEAAGAYEINSPHTTPITYRPGNGAHERWAEDTRRAGYRRDVTFVSYHQMGSCRMGLNPATSAIGADNESHEVKDLFVVDASTFPTASGVNPMLSIYGIANRAAKKIAARLT